MTSTAPFPSDLDIARAVDAAADPRRRARPRPARRRGRAVRRRPRRRSRSKASGASRPRNPRGKYVVVSGDHAPRRSARASRTTTVGLAQGLNRIGRRAAVTIRQPSLGPGVRDQGRRRRRRLQPDHPDGGLQPPPDRRRPRDRRRAQPGRGVHRQPHPPRQRARASTSTRSSGRGSSTSATARCARSWSGLGGRENGYPRETQFVITVASEVMAILALASDLQDLRARLGRVVLATTPRRHADHRRGPQGRGRDDRAPARRAQAEPAPDPRGRAGVRALRAVRQHRPRQQLGARRPGRARDERHRRDRGGLRGRHGRREVLRHQVPRVGARARTRRSIVATVRALKMHGGVGPDRGRQAARPGAARGQPGGGPARRREPRRADRERRAVRGPGGRRDQHVPDRHAPARSRRSSEVALAAGARDAVVARHFTDGGAGAEDLAAGGLGGGRGGRAGLPAALSGRHGARRSRSRRSRPASTAPRASTSRPAAAKQLAQYEAMGFGNLPICMAKTQYSLSHDPKLLGRPTGFRVPIREVRLAAGAGFVTPLAGRHADDAGPQLQAGRRADRHRRGRERRRAVLTRRDPGLCSPRDPRPGRRRCCSASTSSPGRCSARSARSSFRAATTTRCHRLAFRVIYAAFKLAAPPSRPYEFRDRIMAYYGPISLILLPAWWLVLLALGFAAIFWVLGEPAATRSSPAARRCSRSGSCGRRPARRDHRVRRGGDRPRPRRPPDLVPADDLQRVLAARAAGEPARGARRLPAVAGRDDHAHAPAVRARRHARPVGALGAVVRRGRGDAQLAAGARVLPVAAARPLVGQRRRGGDGRGRADALVGGDAVGRPGGPRRSGPATSPCAGSRPTSGSSSTRTRGPMDATSVDRARFDEALDVLEASGVPLVEDRDQAWRDFNGWRVNYDAVLRGLEKLTMAPTPWWDRPMHSAWETDEPDARRGAEAAPPTRPPRRSGEPRLRRQLEPRGGDQPGGHDQRDDHAQDPDAPHRPVDRAERLAARARGRRGRGRRRGRPRSRGGPRRRGTCRARRGSRGVAGSAPSVVASSSLRAFVAGIVPRPRTLDWRPMLTLVLTRHGLTDRSTPEQHLGQRIDVSINDAGRRQAEALARRLAPVAFDRVFTSPLFRARETAAIVAPRRRDRGRPAAARDGLRRLGGPDVRADRRGRRGVPARVGASTRTRCRAPAASPANDVAGARPRLPRRPARRAPGVARQGVVPRGDLGLGRRDAARRAAGPRRSRTPRPTGSWCASRWGSRSASSGERLTRTRRTSPCCSGSSRRRRPRARMLRPERHRAPAAGPTRLPWA